MSYNTVIKRRWARWALVAFVVAFFATLMVIDKASAAAGGAAPPLPGYVPGPEMHYPIAVTNYGEVAVDASEFGYGKADLDMDDPHNPNPRATKVPAVVDATINQLGTPNWLVTSAGRVHNFLGGGNFGDMTWTAFNGTIVAIAQLSNGSGYWLAASDGGVYTFGDARFYGSLGDRRLNAPVTDIVATPSGRGYYLLSADGGVFTFGDARFYGSAVGRDFIGSIAGMALTQTGRGYWLASEYGDFFAFGDANVPGKVGNWASRPGGRVADIIASPDNDWFWIVDSMGRVNLYGPDGRYDQRILSETIGQPVALGYYSVWLGEPPLPPTDGQS